MHVILLRFELGLPFPRATPEMNSSRVNFNFAVIREIKATDSDENSLLEYGIANVACSGISNDCEDWFTIDEQVSGRKC